MRPSLKGSVVHWILFWNHNEALIKVIQNIIWFVVAHIFHIILIYLKKYCHQVCSYYGPSLYTTTTSAHFSSSGKKPFSKHSLKFLARKPPKMSLYSLTIMGEMLLGFEALFESNRLIAMDILLLINLLKSESWI